MATRRQASLKPQLNQIRSWVQEGATDIWIAHKLESTPASIARFRRQHALVRGGEAPVIEDVEIEDVEIVDDVIVAVTAPTVPTDEPAGEPDDPAGTRRRGRRGGGGRGRSKDATDTAIALEGVFDHGDDGYGLWLDGAVRDAGVYRTHWAGQRAIVVRITADEIVIRRA